MDAEVAAREDVARAARTPTPWTQQVSVLGILRTAAYGLLVVALLHDVFAALAQNTVWPLDFASYYMPAHALLYFPSVGPYDFTALGQLNVAHHLIARDFAPYIYSPMALYLLSPVAAFPFNEASFIWALCSHVAAFGSALLLADAFAQVTRRAAALAAPESLIANVRHLLDGTAIRLGRWQAPLVPFALCASVVLFAYPTVDTYNLGQINLVVLFFLVLAFHSHVYDRPVLAGFAVAIAGALKLTPLLFLAFFFARGAWKALASGLAFSVLFFAIPLFLLTPHIYSFFFAQLNMVDANFVPYPHNESFVGALLHFARLFVHAQSSILAHVQQIGEAAGIALAAVSIGSLAVIAWLRGELAVRGTRTAERLDLDWLGFALVTFAYLLATPLLWSHAYVVALPAALMLAVYPLLRARPDGAAWDRMDSALLFCGLVALGLFMVQLPLGADHGLVEAQNHTGLVLLMLRAVGTLIAWGALAALLAPRLRRA